MSNWIGCRHQGAARQADLQARRCRGVSDRSSHGRQSRSSPHRAGLRCWQHGGLSLLRRLQVHRRNRPLDEGSRSIGLNYREAAELVATVAEALHYAHKQGLVHRDVKPGNILIETDGQPYVVDFGLALREENIGKGPKYAGTPAYMSPEQARGEGHRVDGRSDIFSLGVVFYELLVGRQPFRGDTQAELFEQVTSYEPRPLRQYDDSMPKELERICHKAMAKRARERYSTATTWPKTCGCSWPNRR